jgi:hypothetical protein
MNATLRSAKVFIVGCVLAVSMCEPALASRENDRICDKEYAKEPIERTVCKALGDHAPNVRDCLRGERAKSGGGAKDNVCKSAERHVKCFERAIRSSK